MNSQDEINTTEPATGEVSASLAPDEMINDNDSTVRRFNAPRTFRKVCLMHENKADLGAAEVLLAGFGIDGMS